MPIFMKETGMFVEGVYEIPEVREIHPGHLVRSGNSSAYDINFGFEAGAAAILLLLDGKTGVTISKVKGRKIEFIESSKAIVQRHVDLDHVAMYEVARASASVGRPTPTNRFCVKSKVFTKESTDPFIMP